MCIRFRPFLDLRLRQCRLSPVWDTDHGHVAKSRFEFLLLGGSSKQRNRRARRARSHRELDFHANGLRCEPVQMKLLESHGNRASHFAIPVRDGGQIKDAMLIELEL